MARPPAPPTQSSPAYALTLFILGVMVSLLALLGRLSQEMEGRLLFDLSKALTRTTDDVEPALPALIDGLHTPEQRLVALGFAVGAAALLAGGVWWLRARSPIGPQERASARLARAITACLLLGMLAALVGSPPTARLVVVAICLGLSLLGFVVFVLLLVRGAPPAR